MAVVKGTGQTRLIYVDPNDLSSFKDYTYNDAKDNVYWNQEELSMFVDLQVIVPNRDDVMTVNYDSEIFQVSISDTSERTKWMSFLSGEQLKKDKNETFLTDSFTNMSYSEISKNGVSNKETLGIESIDIEFDSHFYPQVTIKFIDVHGYSLMNPAHEETSKNGKANGYKGFFRSLFHFPYPRFLLTIKGPFGSAETFTLAVNEFHSSFNSKTGNFEVTVSFIGYMYGVYSDIPLNMLIVAPFLDSNNPGEGKPGKYWCEKLGNEFQTKEGKSLKTFVEFINEYGDFETKLKENINNENMTTSIKEFQDNSKKTNLLELLLESFFNLLETIRKNSGIDGIVKGLNKFDMAGQYSYGTPLKNINRDNIKYFLEKNTIVFYSKNRYQTIQNEAIVSAYNLCLKYANELGAEYYPPNINEIFTNTIQFNERTASYDTKNYTNNVGINLNYASESTIPISVRFGNIENTGNSFDPLGSMFNNSRNSNISTNEKTNDSFKNIEDYRSYYEYCYGNYIKKLYNDILGLDTKNEELNKEVEKEEKLIIDNILGYKPHIENIYRMIFAHIDTFIHFFYTSVISKIGNNRSSLISKVSTGINILESTDILNKKNKSSLYLPPFPMVYKNEKNKQEVIYPSSLAHGSVFNKENMVELNFIDTMINAAEKIETNIIEVALEKEANKAAEEALETYELKFIPNSVSDIFLYLDGKYPYEEKNEKINANQDEGIKTFFHHLINRIFLSKYTFWHSVSLRPYMFVNRLYSIANTNLTYALDDENQMDVVEIEYFNYLMANNNKLNKNKIENFITKYNNIGIDNIVNYIIKEKGSNESIVYNTNVVLVSGTSINTKDNVGSENGYNMFDTVHFTKFIKTDFPLCFKGCGYGLITKKIYSYDSVERKFEFEKLKSDYGSFHVYEEKEDNIKFNKLSGIYEQIKNIIEKYNGGNIMFNEKTINHFKNKFELDLGDEEYFDFYVKTNKDAKDYVGHYALVEKYSDKITESKNSHDDYKSLIKKALEEGYPYTNFCYYYPYFNTDESLGFLRKTSNKNYLDIIYFLVKFDVLFTDEVYKTRKTYLRMFLILCTFGINTFKLEKIINILNNENRLYACPLYYLLYIGGLLYITFESCLKEGNDTEKSMFPKIIPWNYTGNTMNNFINFKNYFNEVPNSSYGGVPIFSPHYEAFGFYYLASKYDNNKKEDVTTATKLNEYSIKDPGTAAYLKGLFMKYAEQLKDGDFITTGNNATISTKDNTYYHVIQNLSVDTFLKKIYLTKAIFLTNSFVYKSENNMDVKDIISTFYGRIVGKFSVQESTLVSKDASEIEEYKLSLYLTLKNLYDKWLAGYKPEQFKLSGPERRKEVIKSRFSGEYNGSGNDGEFNNFLFVDSFYNDIGSDLYVDIRLLFNSLKSQMDSKTNTSIYEFMNQIAQENKLLFLSLPFFNNFYNKDSINNMFIPQSFYSNSNMTRRIGNTYLIMYTHEPSHMLEDEDDSEYSPDGFNLNDDEPINMLFPLKGDENDTEHENIYVPSFAVSYGKQNQQYFKNINVNMDNPRTTDYSLANVFQLANMGRDGSSLEPYIVGQDLFSIYSNRSYTCNVEMMGCANIMPMMYFQLNNIPMFRGAYMINKVNHHIQAGEMTTTFQGTRMSKNLIPFNKDIFSVRTYSEMSKSFHPISEISGGKELSLWMSAVKEVADFYVKEDFGYGSNETADATELFGEGSVVIKDCSGFVSACLKKYGIGNGQYGSGEFAAEDSNSLIPKLLTENGFEYIKYWYEKKLGPEDLMEGDILAINELPEFNRTPPDSIKNANGYKPRHHVEIYAGNGMRYSWGNPDVVKNGGLPCKYNENYYTNVYRLKINNSNINHAEPTCNKDALARGKAIAEALRIALEFGNSERENMILIGVINTLFNESQWTTTSENCAGAVGIGQWMSRRFYSAETVQEGKRKVWKRTKVHCEGVQSEIAKIINLGYFGIPYKKGSGDDYFDTSQCYGWNAVANGDPGYKSYFAKIPFDAQIYGLAASILISHSYVYYRSDRYPETKLDRDPKTKLIELRDNQNYTADQLFYESVKIWVKNYEGCNFNEQNDMHLNQKQNSISAIEYEGEYDKGWHDKLKTLVDDLKLIKEGKDAKKHTYLNRPGITYVTRDGWKKGIPCIKHNYHGDITGNERVMAFYIGNEPDDITCAKIDVDKTPCRK